MKRTELLNKLSIFITPIITLIVYVTGFSVVDLLSNKNDMIGIFSESFITRLNEPSTKIAIDIAIITIISMLLIRAIDLIKIKISIANNDRTGELYIKNRDRRSKIVEITLNINLYNNILKNIISKLGTLKIRIYKPHGVNVIIKNKFDFTNGAIDDQSDISFITVDILKLLDRGVYNNEIYVLLEIEANTIVHDMNRQVTTELEVDARGQIQGLILWLFRWIIVNAEMDKHHIRIRK